jgi:hypothetical protein
MKEIYAIVDTPCLYHFAIFFPGSKTLEDDYATEAHRMNAIQMQTMESGWDRMLKYFASTEELGNWCFHAWD